VAYDVGTLKSAIFKCPRAPGHQKRRKASAGGPAP